MSYFTLWISFTGPLIMNDFRSVYGFVFNKLCPLSSAALSFLYATQPRIRFVLRPIRLSIPLREHFSDSKELQFTRYTQIERLQI